MAGGFTEILRRGILEKNWVLVKKAYTGMTGDKLDVEDDEVSSRERDSGQIGTGVKKPLRSQRVKITNENMFVDVEGEARAAARKTPVKTVKKQKREPDRSTGLVKKKCSECGEFSRVRQDIITSDSSWKCDDCILAMGER